MKGPHQIKITITIIITIIYIYIYIYIYITLLPLGVITSHGYGYPHYMTFDGAMIHYQGLCKFDMASPRSRSQIEDMGLTYFRVLHKNERRYGNNVVAYPSYVEVHVYDVVIRVEKNKYITVIILYI